MTDCPAIHYTHVSATVEAKRLADDGHLPRLVACDATDYYHPHVEDGEAGGG